MAIPEDQQTTAAEQAAEAELQGWLAGQTGVIVHSHGGLTPEQWTREVDGHSFYFRERDVELVPHVPCALQMSTCRPGRSWIRVVHYSRRITGTVNTVAQ